MGKKSVNFTPKFVFWKMGVFDAAYVRTVQTNHKLEHSHAKTLLLNRNKPSMHNGLVQAHHIMR
jgi:hypothetical protein